MMACAHAEYLMNIVNDIDIGIENFQCGFPILHPPSAIIHRKLPYTPRARGSQINLCICN